MKVKGHMIHLLLISCIYFLHVVYFSSKMNLQTAARPNYNEYHVIFFRCDGQRMCAMPVSSEVFGDPCPNTRKYVEVTQRYR